jgi:hypothetical protein
MSGREVISSSTLWTRSAAFRVPSFFGKTGAAEIDRA